MLVHDKKINYLFINWLTICLISVFLIILVGGLTRLTNSGLSITEWELFRGIMPPLNEKTWNDYFELYKEIPQFKLVNYDMNLDEFKIIFYWEYFHRILGRFIGIFFLIPLLYFHITKKINRNYIFASYFIFLLIVVQGVIGWYMVKSGLVNDVTVSHYRLSLHLSTALIIISSIFWLIINIRNNTHKEFFSVANKNIIFQILFFLILLQVILGAFVSGLDAGRIYQTWPLMGHTFIPNDLILENLNNIFDFTNHSLVQFYHRNLAYLISFYIFALGIYIYKKKIKKIYNSFKLMIFFLIIQIILGVLTLLSGLNIYLASAHQIGSVLLILGSINLYYSYIK
tara:strand:+ start:1370 stop:2395 length:1026 start_codon:yes stop_codon:yes gene_type:complete